MSVQQIFNEVEKPSFSYQITVESTLRRILLNLGSQPLTQRLIACVKTGNANTGSILERLIDLTRQSVDPRYENPLDTAMATYLFVLQQLDPRLALVGAEAVINVPATWWAARVAQVILERTWVQNTSPIVVTSGVHGTNTTNDETKDLYLVSSLTMSAQKQQQTASVIPVESEDSGASSIRGVSPDLPSTAAELTSDDTFRNTESKAPGQ